MITRRHFGQLAAGLAGLGAFPAVAAAQPTRGGTLVMATSVSPTTLNLNLTTSVPDFSVGSLVQEGLVRLDRDLSPAPNLAESWTVSPDGLEYTFKLVTAKWNDGTDFTSADVKFTLEEVSAQYGARFAVTARNLESIDTPDPRTVVIRLKQSYGPFLFTLSGYANAAILPKHVFEGTDIPANPASTSTPVGTGPFMVTEWASGDYITLERNPHYWRPGRPYLDRIVFRVIPNPSSTVLALKAGAIDYSSYYYIPVSQSQEILDDDRLQVRQGAIPGVQMVMFNLRRAPFDNPSVRQALLHALDREFIHRAVYHGLGTISKSHFNSELAWAHNPEVDLGQLYPFDLDKANAMLDAAGLERKSDGVRFDVQTMYDSSDPNYTTLAQVLQRMWGEVGVRVISQASTRNVIIPQVFNDWDFDVTIQAYSTAGDPALGIARTYVTSSIVQAPFVNCSGYSNPEVDRLFEEGDTASAQEERAAFYRQVQVILAQDLPVLPIWQPVYMNVASTRVQGPWATATGYEHWEDVWLTS